MERRPDLDDLLADRATFIGPPPPPEVPKFTPPNRRAEVYQMMIDDLITRMQAETDSYLSIFTGKE